MGERQKQRQEVDKKKMARFVLCAADDREWLLDLRGACLVSLFLDFSTNNTMEEAQPGEKGNQKHRNELDQESERTHKRPNAGDRIKEKKENDSTVSVIESAHLFLTRAGV